VIESKTASWSQVTCSANVGVGSQEVMPVIDSEPVIILLQPWAAFFSITIGRLSVFTASLMTVIDGTKKMANGKGQARCC
jgi:hypothetical protein